ncbi:MAG: CZB domain-containing protein, partial [Proteobacteria bacterium]|nr:CZB domain-containing protein [Pseudomonadota bacterium]
MFKRKKGLLLIAAGVSLLIGLAAPLLAKFAVHSFWGGFLALSALAFVCIMGACLAVFARIASIVSILREHVLELTKGDKGMGQGCGLENDPEFGALATTLDDCFKKLGDKMKNVRGHSDTLQCASRNMLTLSQQVLEKCDATKANTRALGEESSRVSSKMDSVAAAVEQASNNIDMVAAASEEMHATVSEIAKNMDSARTITGQAVDISGLVTVSMEKLGTAASQITHITDTISEISAQTNLLALNATIESARAGEAGKGFAVVAGEIKSLAEQTSVATLKIREMIEGVSSLTKDSIRHITGITDVIGSMSEMVTSIAVSLEEQSAATREISENAGQAATGMAEINTKVTHSSKEVQRMSDHVQGITKDSLDIGIRIFESKINTDEVMNISDILSLSANEIRTGRAAFNIGEVKVAHMGWRTTLEAVLANLKQMEPEQVVSHIDCAFGKWYFSEGKSFSDNPLYQEIGVHHEAVHTRAKDV